MHPSRVERVNVAARWIASYPGQLRYDTFSALSDHLGVPKDVLKKDLWALAYFVENADLRKVPRYLQDAVRELRRNSGRVEKSNAQQAVDVFLAHSPLIDIEERARKVVPSVPKRVLDMMRAYAEVNYGTAQSLAEVMKLPKARAVSMAWQGVGRKIHDELPRLRLLQKESLEPAFRELMLQNLQHAIAKQQYTHAKALTLQVIGELLPSAKGGQRARLMNLEKALRRVAFRAYPKKLKGALKAHHAAFFSLSKSAPDAASKKRLGQLYEISKRLSIADGAWLKYRQSLQKKRSFAGR